MKKILLIICILAIPTAAMAWPWSRDLMNQPSIKPQEPPINTFPKDSVPVGGLWTKVADRDAAEGIKNPVPATEISIAKGHALFTIYCFACHGEAGNGPVGLVFEPTPVDLSSDYVDEITDGWIWGTITFGSYFMPRYGYDMTPAERWDVVNYIRKVLRKSAAVKSGEEPAGEVVSQAETQGKE